ncbi:hypothetical protein [Xenorhabdus stockiae]|uniref:hypothetical protein n=1 Tax=Xenorhabdus stockiae TaxID=351614 RepID=UPI00406461F6
MSNNENENIKPKKFIKTKKFLYHATGFSDIVFIRKIFVEVFDKQRNRFSLLKKQYDDFKSQDSEIDFSKKIYADFFLSIAEEKEILQRIKSAKRRWLVLLTILGVAAVAAFVVCLSTLFVSPLPFSVYLKSWGILALIIVFGGYVFIKSMVNEFVAWQMVNKRHSQEEGGGFESFTKTDWIWQTLNFQQCGKQDEEKNENINRE